MAKITLQTLGKKLADKRGKRGIRETAKEIGISHGTLSRLERGYLPDLETFKKICAWLDVNPNDVLSVATPSPTVPSAAVHFRKKEALAPETAQALAEMILAAQRALLAMNQLPDEVDA
ncbi:MAG TPA: helix-turn-helix transcriptional regulator [Pyrinomonadaceae bacterium]|nr:helix-turn-helix transcriptional regulator [Pyrinomonadaceae bacterium]